MPGKSEQPLEAHLCPQHLPSPLTRPVPPQIDQPWPQTWEKLPLLLTVTGRQQDSRRGAQPPPSHGSHGPQHRGPRPGL